MATPAEPATDALYQALSTPEPDPQVVHTAIEEIRYLSGQNVIAAIGAQITELKAKIDSQGARIDVKFSRIEAQITEVRAEIKAQGARIDAQTSRIDDLRQMIWRVIWPLIVLLAVPVFGLLYRVLTS